VTTAVGMVPDASGASGGTRRLNEGFTGWSRC
jgi:hypothetical protein